jgi:hypothetical protein
MDQCTRDELAFLIKRLGLLSTMSWEQIRMERRHGYGTEKIARTSISGPIPAWASADVDFFLALRFSDNKPFVGYKNGIVFHVLWIDNKFTLYDHG